MAQAAVETPPHVPVLIDALVRAVSPVSGTWVDGTFGAGGYTRHILDAGAKQVIAIDRDPSARQFAAGLAAVELHTLRFSQMAQVAQNVDGVMLDLGVSSMQLDQAQRGFSFMHDGPLDMRMSDTGMTAADLVNTQSESALADILFLFGEERASRRIAKAIVKRRVDQPFATTLDLADVIAKCLPRPKPGQSHPATRSFQAIRIAVNEEYEELLNGLVAAEQVLKPGGKLAVVTFHSIEDRIVKRYFQAQSGPANGNRYQPEVQKPQASLQLVSKKAVKPSADECTTNARARSAKLRVAVRTDMPAQPIDRKALGIPTLKGARG